MDSSVWIDYLAGVETPQVVWVEREMSFQRLGLTDLILCEVLQGIRSDAVFQRAQAELLRFTVFRSSELNLAISSAANYRHLRKQGITIRNTIDCIVATFCIAEDYPLLHRDRDFDPFEDHLGLQVIRP